MEEPSSNCTRECEVTLDFCTNDRNKFLAQKLIETGVIIFVGKAFCSDRAKADLNKRIFKNEIMMMIHSEKNVTKICGELNYELLLLLSNHIPESSKEEPNFTKAIENIETLRSFIIDYYDKLGFKNFKCDLWKILLNY